MAILDRFRLDDRVALITGGGERLGRAIALALAEAGAQTILVGPDPAPLHATQRRMEHLGQRCHGAVSGLDSEEAVATLLADLLDEFQRIDILVNAMASGRAQPPPDPAERATPFLERPASEWDRAVEQHLRRTLLVTRAVGRQMVHLGSGKILNVAEHAGRGTAGDITLGLTSAAIAQLTRTLALELSPHGIHVNCLAPGALLTADDAAGPFWTAERRAAAGRRVALGRLGEEDDIGPLAVYLASDASDFVSGATFTIDGGGFLPGDWERLAPL